MLSRALILATVMLSILVAAPQAQAQNLEAGKSPSQIFSNNCSACHRSQRGLLKTVPPGSLDGFLREHYTTSKNMAQMMSAYLLSNGATDPRGAGGRLTKQGQDAKSGGQSEPAAEQPVRTKRNRAEQQQPQQQAAPGPDGQPLVADEKPLTKRQKQKLDKKKGGKEPKPAATETPAPAAKPEVAPAEMPKPPEPAPVVIDPKIDAPTSEPVKPAEPATLRPDPVPQVTPAPSTPAPAVSAPAEVTAPSDAPLKPTISVMPPPPPAPQSGPATAPISQ